MKYPETIQNLIECYSKLPSIGKKTAERLALSTLELDEEIINVYCESLKNIKTKIKRCSKCNNYTEEELCVICKDKTRNNEILCIVEETKNIILL